MKNEKLKVNASVSLRAKIKKYPNFEEEKKCWRRGYRAVAGLDEAGRGPLAGPVTAAAVLVRQFSIFNYQFPKIRDSKKLTPKQREQWYEILTNHPDIKYGIGLVSEKVIDKINIFEATKLAMTKALANMKQRLYRISDDRQISDKGRKNGKIDFLILDGNFTIENLPIDQIAIVRGDEKVFSCAAASIIAKVTRDRMMCCFAKKYPHYGFERHKGYGTRKHIEALSKHGPCHIHRKTFRPVKLTLFDGRGIKENN